MRSAIETATAQAGHAAGPISRVALAAFDLGIHGVARPRVAARAQPAARILACSNSWRGTSLRLAAGYGRPAGGVHAQGATGRIGNGCSRCRTPSLGLRAMQESGALAAALPEWRHIECLVVRDFYHRYTVDEHTLVAIASLESITDGAFRGTDGRDSGSARWCASRCCCTISERAPGGITWRNRLRIAREVLDAAGAPGSGSRHHRISDRAVIWICPA